MLDGNEEICNKDPDHSKGLVVRNFPTKKLLGRILEIGPGQGRVALAVLRYFWSVIVGVEPCEYLRNQVKAKMNEGKPLYAHVYDCKLEELKMHHQEKFDAVWI